MNLKFAIIDVETTGGRADQEKIIEIAVALHDGEKVIDTFESLVNPERNIPYQITRITGITNDMVRNAPKFYEIAKQVVEITEGAVFVAHNVRFDYAFVQWEFQRLGFTFTRKQLCTLKMSRRVFKGLEGGFSLGNLIQQFDIKVTDRHRAMADVLATVEVFNEIIRLNNNQFEDLEAVMKNGIQGTVLPEGITMDFIKSIPNATGVYYFHDENGDVVYVGKSIHIRQRLLEHFRAKNSKADKMDRYVKSISYEITGSELVALLLESYEIHQLQPKINRAQRGKGKQSAIISYQNQEGYKCFNVIQLKIRNQNHSGIIAKFDKASQAQMAIYKLKTQFELCDCLVFNKNGQSSCLYQQIGQCIGAGVNKESVIDYNQRADEAEESLSKAYESDGVIIEQGRNENEKAIILIEEGIYQGFGYIDNDNLIENFEHLKNHIKSYPNNSHIPSIIKQYLNTKKPLFIEK